MTNDIKIGGNDRVMEFEEKKKKRGHRDSIPRPLACEANALPLS